MLYFLCRCFFPGVDVARIERIATSLNFFIERRHFFSFSEDNFEKQQEKETEVHSIPSLCELTLTFPAARDHIALGRRNVQDSTILYGAPVSVAAVCS